MFGVWSLEKCCTNQSVRVGAGYKTTAALYSTMNALLLRITIAVAVLSTAASALHVCSAGEARFVGSYVEDTQVSDGSPRFVNENGMTIYRHQVTEQGAFFGLVDCVAGIDTVRHRHRRPSHLMDHLT